MNKLIYHWLIVLLLGCWLLPVSAAQLKTEVDRSVINEGETFNLILSLSGKVGLLTPNILPLQNDYKVLGTSKSSQMSVVNGQRNTESRWVITLMAKKTGALSLPTIQLGSYKSKPLQIKVLPADKSYTDHNQGDVFLEAKLETPTPYVQSQAVYTVRLYFAVGLVSGALSDPTVDNALITRLGKDANYHTDRNGRYYQVIERRYAIFPQQSGTIEINPPVFTGVIQDENNSFGYDHFFGPTGRSIKLLAPVSTLHVKPKPNSAATEWWLPADEMSIAEEWSQSPVEFRVGEPITRTIKLRAKGLMAAQLPEISLKNLADMKVYPDKPKLSNLFDGNTLVGERIDKVALIPTREGYFTLPAIRVKWWNISKNRFEIMLLKQETLRILPAVHATNEVSQPVLKSSAALPPAVMQAPLASQDMLTRQFGRYGLFATGITLLLWFFTLFFYMRQQLDQKFSEQSGDLVDANRKHGLAKANKRLRQACHQHQPIAAKQALLHWAQRQWPDRRLINLSQITNQIDFEPLQLELELLDQVLYAEDSMPWDGVKLYRAVQAYLKQRPKRKPRRKIKSLIPTLNPS